MPADEVRGIDIVRNTVKTLTTKPGVYRMIDRDGEVLYVGKAKNLKNRVTNYTRLEQLPKRLQRMVMATVSMEITTTRSESEALLLEANLIKSLKPRFNILLKDDKSFPYIAFSEKHRFPRIYKYRGEKKRGMSMFGPFASAGDVNRAITTLQKAFLLRPCADSVFKNRDRPCLEYQIKRCSAPCVLKVNEEEYAALLEEARKFLSGKSSEVQERLVEEMQVASDKMEYEKAASLRDRIKALNAIQSKDSINTSHIREADVIGLYMEGDLVCIQVFLIRNYSTLGTRSYFPAQVEGLSEAEIMEAFIGRFYQTHTPPALLFLNHEPENLHVLEEALTKLASRNIGISVPQRGERKQLVTLAEKNAKHALEAKQRTDASTRELLDGVAQLFDISQPIERIEIYDNSHIMGKQAVGGMVVAGPEGFMKQHYRTFSVDPGAKQTGGDDFFMMHQVFTRRFKRLRKEHPDYTPGVWPDLVLIDGGKGQLGVAEAIFADLGLSDSITLVGIAKGPDRNAGREDFYLPGKAPFQLPINDPVLFYLQRLRDEAHRFAITAHRGKRSKAIRQSKLDSIEGVGPTRKKALLQHFGSVKAIEGASKEEIASVSGISKKMAEMIYQHLH